MPNPNLTYDKLKNAFRDADGNILVDLSAPQPDVSAPTNDLVQTIAAAFGYSADAAPDILRVGSGAQPDDDAPSQAHHDIAAAFVVEAEPGA